MVLTTQIGPSGTWARPASTAGGSAGAAKKENNNFFQSLLVPNKDQCQMVHLHPVGGLEVRKLVQPKVSNEQSVSSTSPLQPADAWTVARSSGPPLPTTLRARGATPGGVGPSSFSAAVPPGSSAGPWCWWCEEHRQSKAHRLSEATLSSKKMRSK